jgi:glycosyltransferase involved in cell wall biosynthesis
MLHVHLDAPLPATLATGAPTALFVAGWCVSTAGRIDRLELLADGHARPVAAAGRPRLDVARALRPADDPHGGGYASGFWGLVPVGAASPGGVCRVVLRAHVRGGGTEEAPLAELARTSLPAPLELPAPAPADGPLVAICMATFDPPQELLERQIASIRAQTHRNWVCVISDDRSRPERLAALRALVGEDPRFAVTVAPQRLGFYANFERALALAPAAARHVALADQDDAWDPDKLEVLLAGLGDAQLVFSDMRIVARDGRRLAGSYWETRRNEHRDPLSVLVANSVTGAASLLRREVLDAALPFPPAQFAHFHDHWLALVALSLGEIAYVDRPLYDYVQHGSASLGHAAATAMPTLRDRAAKLRQGPRERVRMWRLHFFVDACRLLALAEVLQARTGRRMPRRTRRALALLRRADRSVLPLARLAWRGARELTAQRPATLGAEWHLLWAFAWRHLLDATASEAPRRLRLDAVPPPTLAPRPGWGGLEGTGAQVVAEKVASLALAPADVAPRVNVLVPSIDLKHLFGGYIAKLNLARRLAARGARVRIVTVDPNPPLAPGWRAEVEAFEGLAGLFDEVEVAFGREGGRLEVSPQDRWIATTWWTAHLADAARRELGGGPFLYLIQEHEPFTFPMGTWAALAAGSYELEHRALFSTELLRGWFRARGLGVFAAGAEAGDAASASFQNAITDVTPDGAARLAARAPRRLLVYARPEPHAARNMYELALLALRRALVEGAFDGWALDGIGTVELGRRVDLGGGRVLDMLPRTAQRSYADVLRAHDVGLALMHTPHPSLVPIEMAAAGMRVVTTTFETKTAAAMAAISPNIEAVAPTVEALAAALGRAQDGCGDVVSRLAGADVAWARSWDAALDDALLARVEGLLG